MNFKNAIEISVCVYFCNSKQFYSLILVNTFFINTKNKIPSKTNYNPIKVLKSYLSKNKENLSSSSNANEQNEIRNDQQENDHDIYFESYDNVSLNSKNQNNYPNTKVFDRFRSSEHVENSLEEHLLEETSDDFMIPGFIPEDPLTK